MKAQCDLSFRWAQNSEGTNNGLLMPFQTASVTVYAQLFGVFSFVPSGFNPFSSTDQNNSVANSVNPNVMVHNEPSH